MENRQAREPQMIFAGCGRLLCKETGLDKRMAATSRVDNNTVDNRQGREPQMISTATVED